MLMKNPYHPGSLTKVDIDALGLSLVDAAKGLFSREQGIALPLIGFMESTARQVHRSKQPRWPVGGGDSHGPIAALPR